MVYSIFTHSMCLMSSSDGCCAKRLQRKLIKVCIRSSITLAWLATQSGGVSELAGGMKKERNAWWNNARIAQITNF